MTEPTGAPANGVYAAPADRDVLLVRFPGPLDLWRKLDFAAVGDKTGLLGAFARALSFPAHFGNNWDALADSVQDLSWLPWSSMVIEIENVERLRQDAPDAWDTALDILSHAATYWSAHGKRFLVLVHGESRLPPVT